MGVEFEEQMDVLRALTDRNGNPSTAAVALAPPGVYEPDTVTAIFRVRYVTGLALDVTYCYERWSDLARHVRTHADTIKPGTLRVDVGILRLRPVDAVCQLLEILTDAEAGQSESPVVSWIPVQPNVEAFEEPETSIGSEITDTASLKADIEDLHTRCQVLEKVIRQKWGNRDEPDPAESQAVTIRAAANGK